jgi:hypothetical protein
VCPHHFCRSSGQLVCPFVPQGARVSLHPDHIHRLLPAWFFQGCPLPLDGDCAFLTRSRSSVAGSRDSAGGVRVNHEGAAYGPVVYIPEDGAHERGDLYVEGGLLWSQPFAVLSYGLV